MLPSVKGGMENSIKEDDKELFLSVLTLNFVGDSVRFGILLN